MNSVFISHSMEDKAAYTTLRHALGVSGDKALDFAERFLA